MGAPVHEQGVSGQVAGRLAGEEDHHGCDVGLRVAETAHRVGVVGDRGDLRVGLGPAPEGGAELKLQDGAVAGHITSAAELSLPKGKRVFALGMVRTEAEAANQEFSYAAGTAQILAEPPEL